MKKISFGLDVGLVGPNQSLKELFLKYLREMSIQINSKADNKEDKDLFRALVVFDNVPINIRTYLASNIEDLIYKSDKINKMDGLILVMDVYDSISKELFSLEDIQNFTATYAFKGFSTLVGFDPRKKSDAKDFRISRSKLIQKTKDLELLYCFEIQDPKKDLKDFFEKILKDQVVKFTISNPELLEQSKKYGKELISSVKKS